MAINWHKIGQMPLLARTLFWHNSVIFHPILTLFFLICSFFEDKSNGDNNFSFLLQFLVFAPVFAPRPHKGSIAHMGPKLPSKCRDVSCLPLLARNPFFQSDRPKPPPPLNWYNLNYHVIVIHNRVILLVPLAQPSGSIDATESLL